MPSSYKELSNYICNECGFNKTVIEGMIKGIIQDIVTKRVNIVLDDLFDKKWFQEHLKKKMVERIAIEVSNTIYGRDKNVNISMNVEIAPKR